MIVKLFQGQMEERLPFMIIVFPEWFKRRFPAAVANVRRNSRNRLVTQYDVHETLRDLLEPAARLEPEMLRVRAGLEVPPDPALSTTASQETTTEASENSTSRSTSQETTRSPSGKKQPPKRGISLFLPIPNYRTCQMASIPPHYCTCQVSCC